MEKRTLTITVQSDWQAALRTAAKDASAYRYQGETLNFETPATFFGQLTSRRWDLVQSLIGVGELSVREISRRVQRDVKRVHEDIGILTELGLLERTERGGVLCPYTDIHVDMHLREAV